MKVLVTGAAGFIGLRVADCLADSGAVVHMVDMFKPAATDKEFYEVLKKSNVEFFKLDGLNKNMGKGTLHFASTGFTKVMEMEQLCRSPRYTTLWDEIPNVIA